MKISVAQLSIADDLEKNVRKALDVIARAANDVADCVCFPEMSLTGYGKAVLGSPGLKASVDDAIERLHRKCQESKITALVGHAYPEHGFLYNRATVLLPDGRSFRYDKMNLVDVETTFLRPGVMPLLFPLGNLTAGVIICRDQSDPFLAGALKEQGADLLFIMAAHYNKPDEAQRKIDKDRALPIARAAENRMHVFLSNTVGTHVGMISLGNSLIVDPDGIVLSSAGETEETILSYSLPDRRR